MTDEAKQPRRTVGPIYTMDHLTVPRSMDNPATYRKFAQHAYNYSRLGAALGTLCLIGGFILSWHGVSAGSATWKLSVAGLSSTLTSATPGVVLIVVGYLIIRATRFRIDSK